MASEKGSRVKIPRGPAAVREELFSKTPLGNREGGKGDEARARRPACFLHLKTLRMIGRGFCNGMYEKRCKKNKPAGLRRTEKKA
jgi:hypothetical protein